MEGKKKLIVFFILLSGFSFGQREIYVRPGLINAGMTITPSFMLNRREINYYVSGHLEGMLDEHLSLRGETFYFVDSDRDTSYFKTSARTYFGLQYHLNKGNFDSHIGLMPGLAIMQVNGNVNWAGEKITHVVPTVAINLGTTFYVWKFFNFFANLTYVHSTIRGITNASGKTDELMISAGLGLNINLIKAK